MRKAVATALFLAAACAQQKDLDELTIARRQLRLVPCGAETAVAGVASVHAGDPHGAFLGDWVIVSVCHADKLLQEAEGAQKPLMLFINGKNFSDPAAAIDVQSGQLTFVIGRNKLNKDEWHLLLYDPIGDPTITLPISAGVDGGRPVPRAPGANATIVLTKMYTNWFTYSCLLLVLVIAIALLVVARRSDMLRDGPAIAGVRQPFNVARVQMAWWFFLIFLGFAYIWSVNGETDTITTSLLGLMGISAATAVAAVAISPTDARLTARAKLIDDEVAALDKVLDQMIKDADDAQRRGNADLQAMLARRRAEIEARRAALIVARSDVTSIGRSRGFWQDLVTDDRGAVAVDRFQIVAWTAILGLVFLYDVLWDLSMPDFSATTLALMGISSGTYIGFKLPQKASGEGRV